MKKIPLKTDFQGVPFVCLKAQSLQLHPEITNEKFLSATNPVDQWFSIAQKQRCLYRMFWKV